MRSPNTRLGRGGQISSRSETKKYQKGASKLKTSRIKPVSNPMQMQRQQSRHEEAKAKGTAPEDTPAYQVNMNGTSLVAGVGKRGC